MKIKKSHVFIYPLNQVIFPYNQYEFQISSQLYQPDQFDNFIGFATKLNQIDEPTHQIQAIDSLSTCGVLLKINRSSKIGDDKNNKSVYRHNGLTFARFKITNIQKVQEGLIADVQILPDIITKEIQNQIMKNNLLENLKHQIRNYNQFNQKHNRILGNKELSNESTINKLVFKCCQKLDLPVIYKLKLLQENSQLVKIQTILKFFCDLKAKSKTLQFIEERVKLQMKKINCFQAFTAQQQYPHEHQLNEIYQKLKSKQLPSYVKEEIYKQIKRISGQENSYMILKHIQTLIQIPWTQKSQLQQDINLVQQILNQDHMGLLQVKQRILQFLSVKFKNENSKGGVICLYGPPGVGKTSICESIAKSLGKKFIKISLGGVYDESFFRGNRKTYAASMPGVIVKALIQAKCNDPVILLDQIQKLGKNFRGNAQHALLQILDPSQNNSFIDHYVGIPVDLSKAMFICTANQFQMSNCLLNRLQLIQVPGYTKLQKLQILKKHLLVNQLRQHGIQNLVSFQIQALKEIIKYSNQLGLRQLNRKLAKICRKMARNNQKQNISAQKVVQLLGPLKTSSRWRGIGVMNGMARTHDGGKLLIVQAIKYPSLKSDFKITGKFDQKIKQSISVATSWINANKSEFLQINQSRSTSQDSIFEKTSIHLHFPQEYFQKQSQSAGLCIVSCLVSLLLQVPCKQNLSMAGQISLHGRVFPVSGIRQICIAAIYQGIKHIIIPFDNKSDIQKIPFQQKIGVNFYPVKTIKEALNISLPTLSNKSSPRL